MKYIGFTTKYYTLWEVTEDARYTYYQYIKNISMDFEKAKMKEPTAEIDLSLRGHSSFKVEREYIKVSCFQFGKYKGQPYADCTDYNYMCWYHNFAENENTKQMVRPFLLTNGYKLWNNDRVVTEEEYKRNEYLKANLPKFQLKVDNALPFKFKCEKNILGRINEDDSYYGELNIPFCKIIFPKAVEQVYNEVKYYLPLLEAPIRIKNRIVCIDEYKATRIDDLTYRIDVVKFHTEGFVS